MRISHTYSSYSDVTCGIPQGSILGPRPFNIGIYGMFLLKSSFDIASYADENTPSVSSPIEDLELKIKSRIRNLLLSLKVFRQNHIKSNPNKCCILFTSLNPIQMIIETILTITAQRKSCVEFKLTCDSCFESHYLHYAKKLVKSYILFQELQRTGTSKNRNG